MDAVAIPFDADSDDFVEDAIDATLALGGDSKGGGNGGGIREGDADGACVGLRAGGAESGILIFTGTIRTSRRAPQSSQSEAEAQSVYSELGPPSSQVPSSGYSHVLLHAPGEDGGKSRKR